MPSLAACAAEEKRREEKRREEKRREEKRREEKRRFFAGWIHFRLLIRFDRLKKRFSLMLKGGLYRVSGGVSTQYGGLTKTGTALPRPGSKGTVP
ncbi:hypothetical protein GHZ62_001798 [Neisseria gonorrhoeae]